MAHDVFISHSSTDKTVADAVCAALENAEVRCWIAPRDVQPGRSFAGEITRAIQQSEIMVLIFSARSNDSEQVLREVQLAVNSHLHIIQFRIEDVHLNDDLRYFLSTPHWLDALTPPLEAHIDRLTASIKTLLAEPNAPVEVPLRTPRVQRKIVPVSGAGAQPAGFIPVWIGRAQDLWRERKPIVLGAAGLVLLLLIWWIAYPRHKTVPYATAQNPLPANPFLTSSAAPQFTPGEGNEEAPAASPTIPQQLMEYLRDPLNIPVNPGDAVPVSRRFILQHEAKVNAAAFSPDSTRIVTGSEDKTAIVWDAQTGKQIGTALPHSASVTAARFSPDGRQILTVDWAVHVWDAETHKEIGHAFPAKGLKSATFSPDGMRVATVQEGGTSDDHLIRVWDLNGRELLKKPIPARTDMYGPVVSFSPDGKRLVTGSNEKAARIWNADTGEPIGDLLRQKSWLAAASFSPDGQTVATWGSDTKARLWNANTGEQLFELDSTPGYYISSIPFSPDGKFIAAIKAQNYPGQFFDVQTGKKHGVEMPFPHPPSVFSPDSKWFATVSYQDNVWLWDVAATRVLNKDIKHDGAIAAMNFSPDGKFIVTASEDQTARVWQIGGGAASSTSTAASSTPVAAAPAPPPVTSSPASAAPTAQPAAFTQETATSIAQRMAASVSSGSIESILSLYGDRVDSLDQGIIGQDGIRDGYQKFFERWPQTTWQLTGPVTMQPADQGNYRVTFPIFFSAANLAARKQSSGNAEETLVLAQNSSGDWKIVYQRETILRSAKTRPQQQRPVVGKPVRGAPNSTPNPADQERQRQAAEEIARRLQSLIPH